MASQEDLEQLGAPSSTTSDENDGNDALTSSDDEGLLDDDKPVDERQSVEDSEISDDEDDDNDDDESRASNAKPRIKLNLRMSISSNDDNDEKGKPGEKNMNGSNSNHAVDNGKVKEENNEQPMDIEASTDAKPAPALTPSQTSRQVATTSPGKEVRPEGSATQDVKMEGTGLVDGAKSDPTKLEGGAESQSDVSRSEVQIKAEEANSKEKSQYMGVVKADEVTPGAPQPANERSETISHEKSVDAADKPIKREEDKNESSTTNATSPATIASSDPSKKTKRMLPRLPLNMKKRKLPLKGEPGSGKSVKARVVDSNESAGPTDAVATALDHPSKSTKPASSTPGTGNKKKLPSHSNRSVRLPPMTSPGLLLPPSSGNFKGSLDASTMSGFSTPAALFDQAMAAAGYTTETRTKRPHRGSSVKRNVGDMFDSHVGFTLHFPDLVPKELWYRPKNKDPEELHPVVEKSESKTPLPDLLLKSLEKDVKKGQGKDPEKENGSRKRQRPWQFSDMVPVSLTLPYPESFIQKRLEYVKQVKEREKAIIKYQDKQEELEIKRDEHEFLHGKREGEGERAKINNPVKVPPIPTPPDPPHISELEGFDAEQYEDKHPIYLPKGKESFVSHLDKECFHITEGRYFGLSSNFIADPHFVGANAPGLSGLTMSCGSGLATSSAASSGGPGVLALTGTIFKEKDTTEKEKGKKELTPKPSKKTASLPGFDKSAKNKFKLKHVGPTPTANSSDLRKIMEEGGELAEKMKTCIIRAAVHASRAGKHGQAFLAPDGKAYPDVSKAFASHAGLKPCMRCKNNKQGAYHCRLRRKHKELDYDGSNSPAELAPLLQVPMEDLIINPKAVNRKYE